MKRLEIPANLKRVISKRPQGGWIIDEFRGEELIATYGPYRTRAAVLKAAGVADKKDGR